MTAHFDAQLVVPDAHLSLRAGALAPWANSSSKYYLQTLESLAANFGFSLDVPFADLDIQSQQIILNGSGKIAVEMKYDDGLRSYRTTKPFEGILLILPAAIETDSNWVRDELEKFRASHPYEACDGKRLKLEALAVKINKFDIAQICALSIGDAVDWFGSISEHLSEQQQDNSLADIERNQRTAWISS